MAKRGMPSKDKSGYYTKYLKLEDGKYRRIYGKTAKECQEKYEEEFRKVLKGEYVKTDNSTYNDWIDVWLEDYLINVKQSTKTTYIQSLNSVILPEFKRLKIQNITQQRIQKWISSLQDKYSPESIQLFYIVFQRTLNDAKTAGLIGKNPCENVKLPKRNPKEMTILSREEIPVFLNAARESDPYMANIFEFFLLTGLRKSELVGLTIDRYNQFEKTITIDRQYSRKEFNTPKSNKSRTLRLPERAIELVENQLKWISSERENNPNFNKLDLIFPSLKGRPLDNSSLYRKLKMVTQAIGKPDLRIHDLRHSYATMLLSIGVDVKTVQENLGHSSASFTLDRYAHSTKEMQKLASEKIDELFIK